MASQDSSDQTGSPPALRFGDDPTQYERARPPHPAWVFDAILDGLGSCRVVDVGCGTGVAALELLHRGCDVIGVEPDERMAAVAAERGIPVAVTTFETWESASRDFDLVCSAQAWHWINPTIGLAKAAAVLGAGGRFAAFWYGHRHEPEVAVAVRTARGLPPAPPASTLDPATPTADAITTSPELFNPPEIRRDIATISYSADQWLEVEASMGTNRAMPEPDRERFFASLHRALREVEPITVRWDTTLVMATRHP